ncbi:M13 family metallopeptidase [Deminuibacter soli]|uniref:M13 family peptidase n=1 Tax=Deminuibacter soli TaxID=2291815 RepID=A0A3E1NEW4_9BACT|nr:M13 family metallopeptidase [Deminuibacter soli]RFM26525.1 M13 family peptidase [Deminuibacter soli]
MTRPYRIASTLAAMLALAACTGKPDAAGSKAGDILAMNRDTTVHPGDDFFSYANGGWIKQNNIPNEESSWGIGNLVVDENLNRLKTINLEAAKAHAAAGTPQQKIGDFWATAMDSTGIEKAGLAPLQPYFASIDSLNDIKGLPALVARFDQLGVGSIISMFVAQDAKNSDAYALQFWQSGLYLPEREYYLKTDSTSLNILKTYQQLVARFLTMSQLPEAEANTQAAAILKLETAMARVHRKLADLRDPYHNYNKMSTAALFKLAPALQVDQYFKILNVPKADTVIVGQPEYYKELNTLVTSTPVATWKAMLRFRLIDNFTEALPDTFGIEKFKFSRLLSGAKERKPRWKRVLRNEESVMGELLGQLFVKEYFNATAKQRYENLVEAIRGAYKTRIEKLSWMSDSTKQKALQKLAAIKKKVGYPDKWKDFSSLQIGTASYVQNLINGNQFWWQYNLNKLGKPVDRNEWDMTPQTYNAYYNPSNNEIVLPAGIFTVPGHRDEDLDDALVYGYAGASTIGHEITHGFDDEGRQFDKEGNLKNWWSDEDGKKFNDRAEVMVRQFNNYVVVDTFKINGKATLGENIADLGGILLGWDAFQQTEQYKKNEPISGISPAERYFLGYALGWLGQTRPEALRNQVLTDVHSPAKFRVNGPFADVDAFYSTYKLTPANKMYLADSARVRIW